jgi:ketosteroid isomerase-like protein
MKKIVFLVSLLLLASTASADTKTEITAALEYFSEVWNEGDVEAIRGYYHPDFVLITRNGPIPLKVRLEDLQAVMQEGQDRGELETSRVTVEELGEKFAMAYGYSSLKFKDGSALNTWFTTVYEKTPFGWKALLTQDKKD